MNVAHFWAQVKEMEGDLPETVHIVALGSRRVGTARRSEAARCLVSGTHRIASDEEAAEFDARQRRRDELQRAIQAVLQPQSMTVVVKSKETKENTGK